MKTAPQVWVLFIRERLVFGHFSGAYQVKRGEDARAADKHNTEPSDARERLASERKRQASAERDGAIRKRGVGQRVARAVGAGDE
jgi:hypothetical protein